VLILSRKVSECIHLGDDIVLTIVTIGNDKVKIGVQAPPGVKVLRTELEVDVSLPLRMAQPQPSDQSQQPIRRAA
jgi:carbon storage regulator